MSNDISPETFYRLGLTGQVKMTAVGKMIAGFWEGPIETFKDIQFISYESWEFPARQAMWQEFKEGVFIDRSTKLIVGELLRPSVLSKLMARDA